jgi:hypothetical protein
MPFLQPLDQSGRRHYHQLDDTLHNAMQQNGILHKVLICSLSIYDTWHKRHSAFKHWYYTERSDAVRHITLFVLLNVIMLNVIMPNVFMPNVIKLNVIMLNVIMLSVIMPNRIMPHRSAICKGLRA